jgi:hypothetical protein
MLEPRNDVFIFDVCDEDIYRYRVFAQERLFLNIEAQYILRNRVLLQKD